MARIFDILSLGNVHGFGPAEIEIIETKCQRGPFRSLKDLVKRTLLDWPHVEAQILSVAHDYTGEQRQLLWSSTEAYHLAKCPREVVLLSEDEQPTCPRINSNDGAKRGMLVFMCTICAYTGAWRGTLEIAIIDTSVGYDALACIITPSSDR